MPPSRPRQPFEELYKELEAKVALLEQGGLSLDDSLAAYEEAVSLAQRCQQLLERAELRITRLREPASAPGADEGLLAADDDEPEAP
jgi:exodeoxyribonuclease VII small subunit